MLKICAVNLISFQQYNKNQTKEFPQSKQTSRKTRKKQSILDLRTITAIKKQNKKYYYNYISRYFPVYFLSCPIKKNMLVLVLILREQNKNDKTQVK